MKIKTLPLFLLACALPIIAACDDKNSQAQAQQQEQSQAANAGQGQQEQRAASVSFFTVEPVSIRMTNELPGRVVSYQVAEIRPQVSGIIQSRLFEEGTFVEEGQQLYQIDPERYEADYEMAKASLQDARARVKNAQNLSGRYSRLIDSNAVSEQEYDDARATLDQARAGVALAEAEVKTAKINLDYTKVYAPISGYISPSGVTKGALVTAQQESALATIRQLDPVYVDMSQAAAEAQGFQERLAKSRMGEPEKAQFEVTLYLGSSGDTYPFKGKLDATDLAVDMQTGAIRLRSVFPNPDNILLPGMFVRASIEDVAQSKAIVVPQKAVQILPGGEKSLWVINDQNKAEQRSVRTGASYQNHWIILNGLSTGERVIVDGTMMLQPGAGVDGEEIELDIDTGETLSVPPNTLGENAPPPKNILDVSEDTSAEEVETPDNTAEE